MKRSLLLIFAVASVITAAVFSQARSDKATTPPTTATAKFEIATAEKNPWTSLTPNVSAEQFQFAIISDRTGGHRKGIFDRAVQQINLLQPEFVMSVGDLIEGTTTNDGNTKQWTEFDGYVKRLDMPFFYTPGNHDAQSLVKANVWKERLGRRYYHFTYKNCLFLVLNAYDEADDDATKDASYKKVRIGKAQRAYIAEALKENANARWTFVFIHPPIWVEKDLTTNGWLEVEDMLKGRKHNVFAGHLHTYRKYMRNGTAYYQLATTGGSSSIRGVEYGEFDQIAWITMKGDTPVLANVLLTGIQNDTLSPFESTEDGTDAANVKGVYPVSGTVTLDGKPAAGLLITFTEIPAAPLAAGKTAAAGNARVMEDGTFTVLPRRGAGGLKPGRWAVTFDLAQSVVIDPKVVRENPVPEKYKKLNTTPFRVDVKTTENKFTFAIEK